jgi:hypothetical protein
MRKGATTAAFWGVLGFGATLAVAACSLNPQPLPPGGGEGEPTGAIPGDGDNADAGASLHQGGAEGGASDGGTEDAAAEGATTYPSDSAAPDAQTDGSHGDAATDALADAETPE